MSTPAAGGCTCSIFVALLAHMVERTQARMPCIQADMHLLLLLLLQTAGAEQAPLVQQLLQSLRVPAAGAELPAFGGVVVHEDCYGVPRFVSATRTPHVAS